MKPIRLTWHARRRLEERSATEAEVVHAIRHGQPDAADAGRVSYSFDFSYAGLWRGRRYRRKRVMPVVAETDDELVVVTVYTFFS